VKYRVCAALLASLAAGAALAPEPAHPQVTPRPGKVDPRVRSIIYKPDQVVALTGHLGFQITVSLSPDETVETVSIGDSVGWQVNPTRRSDTLFLKPVDLGPPTNMTVVTDKRRYNFELTAKPTPRSNRDPEVIFELSFIYPPPPAPPAAEDSAAKQPPAPPRPINSSYSFQGDRELTPLKVFDDGLFTTFVWAPEAALPAVYLVGATGEEELLNFTFSPEGHMLVSAVGAHFVLRSGALLTHIYNDAFKPPQLGPDSPAERPGKRRKKKR